MDGRKLGWKDEERKNEQKLFGEEAWMLEGLEHVYGFVRSVKCC